MKDRFVRNSRIINGECEHAIKPLDAIQSPFLISMQQHLCWLDLLSKARSVGLEPVWSSSFVFLLLPVMGISRWLSRDRPAPVVVFQESYDRGQNTIGLEAWPLNARQSEREYVSRLAVLF